jgi:DNA-directed RNA polymerase specialized sigma24 family protein
VDDVRLERLLDLDQAMTALEASDERLARLVELRHFSGLQLEEAGEVLGLSVATLKRDYRKARAFLHARLGSAELAYDAGS